MCRASNGTLLTNKTDVLSRWREYFNALFNGDTRHETVEALGELGLELSDTTVGILKRESNQLPKFMFLKSNTDDATKPKH